MSLAQTEKEQVAGLEPCDECRWALLKAEEASREG